jgi:hypothetical protein
MKKQLSFFYQTQQMIMSYMKLKGDVKLALNGCGMMKNSGTLEYCLNGRNGNLEVDTWIPWVSFFFYNCRSR